MKGLRIRTVSGEEFTVYGTVTHKYFPNDGLIYYCGGRSFPAEIVIEIRYEAAPC